MAEEQGHLEPGVQSSPIEKSKEVTENDNGIFDCNICLETAQDPVVTLCGHLYCWPCIYKWLHLQTSSVNPQENCPICKSHISHDSLVPLYGHGSSLSDQDSKNLVAIPDNVPRRPPALNTLITTRHSSGLVGNQNMYPDFLQTHPFSAEHYYQNGTMMSLLSPTILMLGEMGFERVFRMPDMRSLQSPNSYTNQRMRRQEVQLDKSLSRVSIFFFCCLIICLILF